MLLVAMLALVAGTVAEEHVSLDPHDSAVEQLGESEGASNFGDRELWPTLAKAKACSRCLPLAQATSVRHRDRTTQTSRTTTRIALPTRRSKTVGRCGAAAPASTAV